MTEPHVHYFASEGYCIGQNCLYNYDDCVRDIKKDRDDLQAAIDEAYSVLLCGVGEVVTDDVCMRMALTILGKWQAAIG